MLTNHGLILAVCTVQAVLLAGGCSSKGGDSGQQPPATAPAAPAWVEPTQWGPAAGGVRLGIATERTRYAVGERVQLSAGARNVSGGALTLRLLASREPDVSFRNDLITLNYPLDDWTREPLGKDEIWTGALSGPLSLAPGKYRLRVVISGDELPASEVGAGPPVWHGEARSNELNIEVVAPAP